MMTRDEMLAELASIADVVGIKCTPESKDSIPRRLARIAEAKDTPVLTARAIFIALTQMPNLDQYIVNMLIAHGYPPRENSLLSKEADPPKKNGLL